MGWIYIFSAAAAEICGVIGLKLFSKNKTLKNMLHFALSFALSFYLLYASFNYINVSTAYAVWIGTGTAGAVLLNMAFFGESRSVGRIVSLALIIIGVVGLKAVS
ncbi:DMT family transporter [Elusimicrobium posterum]|uniref:DMT family transporter n=1 Tax=Elusimicrobium posterum TaxID=3116653 RepID=UPI003C74FC7C